VIKEEDADFSASGLKQSSVIRIGRLAVANSELFLGASGEISGERLAGIRRRIADWILEKEP
jgi:mRNA interferase MazF